LTCFHALGLEALTLARHDGKERKYHPPFPLIPRPKLEDSTAERETDTLSNTLMRREFFLTKNSRYKQAALKGKEPHIQLPLDGRFGFAEIHLNKYLTPHTEIGRQDLNGPSLKYTPLQR
jgi:hypothetical protein